MKKKEVKRIDWIDTLRGLGMFFVVWGHCQKNKTFIRKYIYSFHMPLFFFVSGLTFGKSDELPFKEFVKKKIKSLVVPYIVMNIILYFINIILSNKGIIEDYTYIESFFGIFYSNFKVLTFPCGPAWFLLSLFLVEIIFYFFKKNSKSDFELGIVCSICGIISYVNSLSKYQIRGPWHIEAVFTGIVFYYLGYLFIKNIKKFDFIFKDKTRMLVYGFLFGVLGAFGQVLNKRVSMDGNLYGSIFLFYFNSLCTTAGLICFVRVILRKSIVFKDVGKKTMFFVGYQNVLIQLSKYYFPIFDHRSLYMLANAIIVFIILYILSIPVSKYCPFMNGRLKYIDSKIDNI